MADKRNRDDDVVIQHTPKHLEDDTVFDKRHPAASSFAPMQPAAGVVADDVEERGQNLGGGQTASEAHKANLDQVDKLEEQQREDLRLKSGVAPAPAVEVKGDAAKPAGKADKS